MTAEMRVSESVGTIYITALLLTGRARLAEAAIIRGFEWLDDPDAASEEDLLRSTVVASARRLESRSAREHEKMGRDSSFLPPELRDVLQLPDGLRQCFVLRVLRSLSRESCARLLGVDVGAVDRNTSLAAQALAAMSFRD